MISATDGIGSLGLSEKLPSTPMTPEDRQRILAAMLVSGHLPGIGGTLRSRAEDFVVRERPAYDADGREERHVLVWMRKRFLTTGHAVGEIAQQLGIPRDEIGHAGLKDKVAVTSQRISIPWAGRDALAGFSHPDIELTDPVPHGTKLRRGHLAGNEFEITVRGLACGVEEATTRLAAKLAFLATQGGFDNIYGPQRFGHGGLNLERGLAILTAKRFPRHFKDFEVSAAQSGVFNLVCALRRERMLARRVLLGDVLKKSVTGGLFTCEDVSVDQLRLDAGELVITGPMVGGKSMRPPPGTPAAQLEHEACLRCGLDPERIESLGKQLPGARRPLQVPIDDCAAQSAKPASAVVTPVTPISGESLSSPSLPMETTPADLGPGIRLTFTLPAGCYATTLLRELMGTDCADIDEQVA